MTTPPPSSSPLVVKAVTHLYSERDSQPALGGLSLAIETPGIYGVLGPNGSGKSTLFKLISTILPVQTGSIEVHGFCTRRQMAAVRSQMGIVFQSPSLDKKLTVEENILCQATLVGLSGIEKKKRVDQVLEQLSIQERRKDRCESLSGGLKRRVELAKGILHRPKLLLLDEPSTGLDPRARLDFWQALVNISRTQSTTVLLTTHLLEEAEKCDRLAILHRGKCVAFESPENLQAEAGSQILVIKARDLLEAENRIRSELGWTSKIAGDSLRVQSEECAKHLNQVAQVLGNDLFELTLARPSLEDVFIAKTGDQFESVAPKVKAS